MQTVSTEICELKHEHIDQAFLEDRQRLKSHGEQLDVLPLGRAADQRDRGHGAAHGGSDARIEGVGKPQRAGLERV